VSSVGTYVEANGLRVYYEVYGEGEPLLLIHGGTATAAPPPPNPGYRTFRPSPSTSGSSPPTAAVTAGPTTRRAISATA
jgi:pimeloyl-ACP methyl ester carboxylesterase